MKEKENEILKLKKELYDLGCSYQRLDELLTLAQKRESALLSQMDALLQENRQLKNELFELHSARNVRGAGRKKNDAKWIDSYVHFCRLYQDACTMEEVMEQMQISRATYYRYKKIYQDQGIMS